LLGDPALRARLGRAGQDRVRSRFSMEAGIARLGARFGIAAESASAAAGGA
jgi:hypothetical protein